MTKGNLYQIIVEAAAEAAAVVVCTICMQVPTETRKGCQNPWKWSYMAVISHWVGARNSRTRVLHKSNQCSWPLNCFFTPNSIIFSFLLLWSNLLSRAIVFWESLVFLRRCLTIKWKLHNHEQAWLGIGLQDQPDPSSLFLLLPFIIEI